MRSCRPILLSVILISLMVREISSLVPAPENINVSCHNFKTTVSWSHSKPHPETRFRLNITGSSTKDQVETTDTHYDFSEMIKPIDAYFVDISAVHGDEMSIKKTSQTLTFNYLKVADIKCTLAFPPVSLTVRETEATVSFPNPYHFYQEMRSSHWRNDNSDFEYSITFENKTHTYVCESKEKNCKRDITLEEKMSRYCFILEGKRRENTRINGYVLFPQTQPICASENAEAPDLFLYFISLGLGLSVLVIVVCATIFIVTKAKAYRINRSNLPKVLNLLPTQRLHVPYETVDCICVAELHTSSYRCSLWEPCSVESSAQSTGLGLSAGAPTDPFYMGGGLSCSSNQSCPESETVETVVSQSLPSPREEEESPLVRSNYDRPHIVNMEDDDNMGSGEEQ